eukprot:scaffold82522_cov57-Phaeocystis_antarctica.AAC.5
MALLEGQRAPHRVVKLAEEHRSQRRVGVTATRDRRGCHPESSEPSARARAPSIQLARRAASWYVLQGRRGCIKFIRSIRRRLTDPARHALHRAGGGPPAQQLEVSLAPVGRVDELAQRSGASLEGEGDEEEGVLPRPARAEELRAAADRGVVHVLVDEVVTRPERGAAELAYPCGWHGAQDLDEARQVALHQAQAEARVVEGQAGPGEGAL